MATASPNTPPLFDTIYECPTSTTFGVCLIEEVCSEGGSQDCGSPSRLCCESGCGGKVCSEGVVPSPLCSALRAKALNASQGLLGALVPQCEDDGSFSATQCWEGNCWCVNTTTGLATTELTSPGTPLDCSPAPQPDPCTLEPVSGFCKAYMPRYFYNSTSGNCERFIYGGCGGNDNRFSNYIGCMEQCGM